MYGVVFCNLLKHVACPRRLLEGVTCGVVLGFESAERNGILFLGQPGSWGSADVLKISRG